MKRITSFSALIGIIMLFAFNVNAVTILGTATSGFNSTTEVGNVVAGGSIDPDLNEKVYGFFIPIDNKDAAGNPVPPGTYGVDGFGMSQDSFTTSDGNPIDGPLMNMWFHFNVEAGETANTLTVNWSDLDMSPFGGSQTNDPDGFFEELTIFGMVDSAGADSGSGLIQDAFGQSYDAFDVLADVTVTDLNPSNGLNDFGIVFSNLNITEGDHWLHIGVRAYSDGDLANATWENTRELVSVSITTTPVPEPATVALLGIGIAGLAGRAIRRRFSRKGDGFNLIQT